MCKEIIFGVISLDYKSNKFDLFSCIAIIFRVFPRELEKKWQADANANQIETEPELSRNRVVNDNICDVNKHCDEWFGNFSHFLKTYLEFQLTFPLNIVNSAKLTETPRNTGTPEA